MSSAQRLFKLAPLGCALSAITLSSCALPPKQAWQKIRSDGLISYISYEMRTPRRPLDAPGPVLPVGPASKPAIATRDANRAMVAKASQPAPNSAVEKTNSESASPPSSAAGVLVAHAVPALPGYARSPYTNPPRLIDIKGNAPGSTMICPYTQKPFIVPAAPSSDPPSPALVQKKKSPVAPAPEVKKEESAQVPLKDLAIDTPPNPPVNPAPAANSPPAPGKSLATNNPPAAATSPTTPPSPPAPQPEVKVVPEIPYGTPIVGRPGYVNSPYAAVHQLVDVTGLPPGMEVKCPYTGKLFRVPPQDMAASKPLAIPATQDSEALKK